MYVLLGLLTFLLPVLTQAQNIEFLTIDSSPRFPQAGETVSLTVRALSLDLDRADIAWYVNGTELTAARGQKNAGIVLGQNGSRTRVEVLITDEDGATISGERVFSPASVDIIWESDSYVPQFYRGKRLPSSSTSIRAQAIPALLHSDGSEVASKDIIYTWRKNDAIVASASGRGKSVASFSAPQLFGNDTIAVEVATLDGSLIASREIQIASVDPFVTLYQIHPLFGVQFHKALSGAEMFGDVESSFLAIPYFASAVNENDARLQYRWRVNGTAIAPSPETPAALTINAQNSDGTARIELDLSHRNDYYMSVSQVWEFLFNSGFSAGGSDLFGRPQ